MANEEDKQTVFKENEEVEIVNNHTNQPNDKSSLGIEPNIAGLLAYLVGFVSGLILFFIEKESRFVRFHAMQSTATFLAILILSIVLSLIPIIGWILGLLLTPLSFVLWIFLMYKAYKGEWFKLPIVGDFAEQQADID